MAERTLSAEALDARVRDIASRLRCLVCQNQTIADSHADLALDLRAQIREQLERGATEEDIERYMVARYGEFILYNPPLHASTSLLWFGPALLVAGGLAGLGFAIRRRARLAQSGAPIAHDPDDSLADS